MPPPDQRRPELEGLWLDVALVSARAAQTAPALAPARRERHCAGIVTLLEIDGNPLGNLRS
jgi:glycine/D-amino acid oxidase-like deaminating enzyme